MRFFAWLGQYAIATLAIGALIGLSVPSLPSFLPELIPFLVFLFTVASFLKINIALVAKARRRVRLVTFLMIWLLLASPIVAAGVVRVLEINENLAQALVLWAASPPIGAVVVLSVVLRLDVAHAALMLGAAMLALPASASGLSFAIAHFPSDIDFFALILRLTFFVASAFALSRMIRALAGGEVIDRRGNEVNGLIALILFVFAVAVMQKLAATVTDNPAQAIKFVAVAYAANLFFQALTAMLFFWADNKARLTSAILGGNRNMSVLYANVGATTPELTLFFIASHIPIYTLPWLLRPFYCWMNSDID